MDKEIVWLLFCQRRCLLLECWGRKTTSLVLIYKGAVFLFCLSPTEYSYSLLVLTGNTGPAVIRIARKGLKSHISSMYCDHNFVNSHLSQLQVNRYAKQMKGIGEKDELMDSKCLEYEQPTSIPISIYSGTVY